MDDAPESDAVDKTPYGRYLAILVALLAALGFGGYTLIVRAVDVGKTPARITELETKIGDEQQQQNARLSSIEIGSARISQQLADQKDQLNRIEDAVRHNSSLRRPQNQDQTTP